MIFNHILDLQTLQTDYLILADPFCGEFMQEVLAAVGNFGVNLRHFAPALVAILGIFLCFG